MTPQQIEEHNRVYERAIQIVKENIIVAGNSNASIVDPSTKSKLENAIRLFARVLELNPRNWNAMWLVGKTYQRLGNHSAGFLSFVGASEVKPLQPDILREASISAMYMGRSEEAVSYARRALESQPSNEGLRSNLALAFLLANRLSEAKGAIDKKRINGADAISRNVSCIIDHFIATGRKPPTTTVALESYWNNRSN
jgi:tetratricopeptide (TPR) repeat protein